MKVPKSCVWMRYLEVTKNFEMVRFEKMRLCPKKCKFTCLFGPINCEGVHLRNLYNMFGQGRSRVSGSESGPDIPSVWSGFRICSPGSQVWVPRPRVLGLRSQISRLEH